MLPELCQLRKPIIDSNGFRVSPEEGQQLDIAVRLTGLSKQDYIIRWLLERGIVVQGNPRVCKALRDQLGEVLQELKRIAQKEVSSELLDTIQMITTVTGGLKEERHDV